MKAFSSPKRRKGLIPWYHSSSYEFSYALIASVTGSPASAYVVLTINVRPVQQKNSEASWEITSLPCTLRQLSENDRLLILLFYVSFIFFIIIRRMIKKNGCVQSEKMWIQEKMLLYVLLSQETEPMPAYDLLFTGRSMQDPE